MDPEELERYVAMLGGWPGLVSGPARPLVEDCLVLLDHLGDARTLVDVGSGGGMPGLPLKMARPDLAVTLVEADQRKAAFLVDAAARLGLAVRVVAERAETAGRGPLRESFDLVRVGGHLLAMKGQVEEATAAIATLGGGPASVLPAPSDARARGVVVRVAKVAPTPPAYPRRPGLPNRRPLGA